MAELIDIALVSIAVGGALYAVFRYFYKLSVGKEEESVGCNCGSNCSADGKKITL